MTSREGRQAATGASRPRRAERLLPFLSWFRGYDRGAFRADAVSGVTVALVLIPQSMAYAQLADLPAFYGLYAAFLPPLIAALFGSSNQLATGPVAVVSLMTSTALAPLATAGSEGYIAYAMLLALLVGVFQLALGLLRLGMIVNFLSHPVVSGFTNAAAIIIATSQLPKLFGVEVEKAEHHLEWVADTVEAAVHHTHWPTLALGATAFLIMIVLRKINRQIPNVLAAVAVTTVIAWATGFEDNEVATLDQIRSVEVRNSIQAYNEQLAEFHEGMVEKVRVNRRYREAQDEYGEDSVEAIQIHAELSVLDVHLLEHKERASARRAALREFRLLRQATEDGPSEFVLPAAVSLSGRRGEPSWRMKIGAGPVSEDEVTLMAGGAVVGTIPPGLPSLAVPRLDFGLMLELLPMAIIISLLGFMEAISIAKAMAARTRQRLDPDQELVGQGLANLVGCLFRSYPVSGSFSRSAVNLQAGAVTGLSSAVSSVVVLLTLLFFTPLLYFLPQSVLAAIIMMAVIGLINIGGFLHAWRVQKTDGLILLITFVATLAFAPHLDKGIFLGVVLSLAAYLYRNMKPRIATLAKTPKGEFRDARRWHLDRCRHVAVIRFSSSLFFANVIYLQDVVLEKLTTMPELKHVLIVGNGINELDSSGEVLLSQLVTRLHETDIELSFSGLNDDVIEVMQRTHLFEKIGADHFFYSVAQAVDVIHQGVCLETPGHECPLIHPKFHGLPLATPMPGTRVETPEEDES